MSHNIVLKNIKIKDLKMLDSVVQSLSGGKAHVQNPCSTFRTYVGQPDKCHAKIAMPGQHDVGLIKQQDGSYSVVFDPYRMDRVFQHPKGSNAIGAVLQEYALRDAEYVAACRGMSTQRVPAENGTVTLEVVRAG